jgi:hypothetical protein
MIYFGFLFLACNMLLVSSQRTMAGRRTADTSSEAAGHPPKSDSSNFLHPRHGNDMEITSNTLQSKCLRIIGNLPRCTPIPLLHTTFNVLPIHEQIHYMTARFFNTSSNHTNPLIRVRVIGNYTIRDLHQQYKKYIQKRPTHILLQVSS